MYISQNACMKSLYVYIALVAMIKPVVSMQYPVWCTSIG